MKSWADGWGWLMMLWGGTGWDGWTCGAKGWCRLREGLHHVCRGGANELVPDDQGKLGITLCSSICNRWELFRRMPIIEPDGEEPRKIKDAPYSLTWWCVFFDNIYICLYINPLKIYINKIYNKKLYLHRDIFRYSQL